MDVPLTPLVVDVVTFDRAPLGRRGYNEDQVDDFLDRIQATLAGEDNLTAGEVRAVEFDPAPFIRRGYHEDQVDEFLDLVVEELDRREGNPPGGALATDSAVGGFPWSRTAVAVSGPSIGGTPGNAPAGAFGSTGTPGTSSVPGNSPAYGTSNASAGTPGMPSNAPAGSPGHSSAPGSNLAAGPSGTSGTPSNTPAGTPAPTSHTNTSGPANPTTGTPGTTPGSNHLTAGSPGTTSIPSPGNYPGHAPGSSSGGNPSAGSPGSTSAPGSSNYPASGSNPSAGSPGSTNVPGSSNYPASGSNPSARPGSSDHPDPIAWLPFPPAQPRVEPPLTPAEQTNPMLFAQPPSWPSPSTQPLKREPGAASGPPNPSVAATTDETGAPRETEPGESPIHAHSPSVEAGQAASALRAGATSDMAEEPEADPPKRTLADYAPKQPPPATEPTPKAPDTTAEDALGQAEPEPAQEATAEDAEPEPTFPLPPAPPGEPGYAPSDVARLMKLLTTAPDREQLTNLTFSLTTTGGYHTGTVDALRQAWIDALPTKQP
jgi:DivIVA domain-containing protein